jgi:hypothetical protein
MYLFTYFHPSCGVGSHPALLITKKGALDSQPQVIKLMDGFFFFFVALTSLSAIFQLYHGD